MLDHLLSALLFLLGLPAAADAEGTVKGESIAMVVASKSATLAPAKPSGIVGILNVTQPKTATGTGDVAVGTKRANILTSWKATDAKSAQQLTAALTAFKQKTVTIRDAKKKAAVVRIQDKLTDINTRRIAWAKQMLTLMSNLADKVSQRAQTPEAKRLAAAADTAISAAMDTVTAQSAKQYVISITTETKLKADTEAVRKQMAADHVLIETAVKTANQALVKAITVIEPENAAPPHPTAAGTKTLVAPETPVVQPTIWAGGTPATNPGGAL
jgi:hypothetical protein